MTSYQRIFGTGPRGTIVCVITFAITFVLNDRLDPPPLHGSATLGIAALLIGVVMAVAIAASSLASLPPGARGKELVTAGAFRWVRHPLYAALLGPFDFGLALYMDGWPYLVWALLQYPIWHWNIAAEERLMHNEFGETWAEYCKKTGRFLPKLVRS